MALQSLMENFKNFRTGGQSAETGSFAGDDIAMGRVALILSIFRTRTTPSELNVISLFSSSENAANVNFL
jgi:hypothetical protein